MSIETYFFSGDEETFSTLDNAAVVDVGGSPNVVTMPSTDHGLKASTWIYIQGTINYNGLRYITAVAANTFNIYAVFNAETPAGSETIKTMVGFADDWELLGYELTLDAASATAEDLTVTKDANQGAAWDVNILTEDMNTDQYIIDQGETFPIFCKGGTKIDFAWANTNNKLYGLTVRVKRT